MVTMLQVHETTRYLLIERCLCIVQASRFLSPSVTINFEFYTIECISRPIKVIVCLVVFGVPCLLVVSITVCIPEEE